MSNNENESTLPEQWKDWRWQQKNACRDEASLRVACGGWDDQLANNIRGNLQGRKIQVTPYYIDLIKKNNTLSFLDNPLWRQVVPFWGKEVHDGYDGESENWELGHEMKTPICQHKYDNRVILRMVNTCNSYCQFCFEALRTLKTDSDKLNAGSRSFNASLEYIKNTPSVEEVILSGGDPLMLTDNKLEECLSAIRDIGDSLLIRLHSRALTFNPFRVTDRLIEILAKYRVNSFGVHVCHPWELSSDFTLAVKKIQKAVPIVFANSPFLKGINDDEKTLHKLFIELYRMGVKPYYLYHFMPFSPGSAVYKASIDEAINIMSQLKRRVSNIALPEYVLPHAKGKFTVPLINDKNPTPKFIGRDGKRYYSFTNWQGEVCEWLDN